jgi:arginine N-succinyltransferase
MGNSQFIADLMPKFPIYTNLLPQEAQDVIGKPHDDARGAVRLLTEEGFRAAGAVDIFDGGPCYEVPARDIRTLRKARRVHLAGISGHEDVGPQNPPMMLVASLQWPDVRMLAVPVVQADHAGIILPPEAARVLGVKIGDPLTIAPLNKVRSGKK